MINIAPFSQTPMTQTVVVTAALAGIATGAVTGASLLMTADPGGARITRLVVKPCSTALLASLVLFLVKAGTPGVYLPIDSVLLPAGSAPAGFDRISNASPMFLEEGDSLYVGSEVAQTNGVAFFVEWSAGVPKYVAVGTNSSVISAYRRKGEGLVKLFDLTVGTGTTGVNALAFSPDGAYLAAGLSTPPYLAMYGVTTNAFQLMSTPPSLPSSVVAELAFSPDGMYLAAIVGGGIWVGKRSGETFTEVSLGDQPSGTATAVTFSPDGLHLAVIISGALPIIYKREGDVFSKISTPNIVSTKGRDASYSPDGVYLAIISSSAPMLEILKREGDQYTQAAPPAFMPSDPYGIAFSANGEYMAVGAFNVPRVMVYKRDGETFNALPEIADIPNSFVFDVAFSDDGRYLYASTYGGPYLFSYRQSGDTFTRVANMPSSLPPSRSLCVAYSPPVLGS